MDNSIKSKLQREDPAKVYNHLKESGVINPRTGKPYSYHHIYYYLKGDVYKSTNDIIEAGILSFLEKRKAIQDALVKI